MPSFFAIAAMSENRVIGNQGKIPWHIPEDFRWFKHKTMGGTLIMGRKTYDSIGKPLPGRKTVVITKTDTPIPGVEICTDLRKLPSDNQWSGVPEDRLWVCGGAQIYQQLLAKCFFLYLTRVNQRADGDVHFPPFEDTFRLEETVYENHLFRIERWLNIQQEWKDFYREPDVWPLPAPQV